MHNLDENDRWQAMEQDAQAEAERLAQARRLRGKHASEDGQPYEIQLDDELERLLGGGEKSGP
jgi:hypothetical protein